MAVWQWSRRRSQKEGAFGNARRDEDGDYGNGVGDDGTSEGKKVVNAREGNVDW